MSTWELAQYKGRNSQYRKQYRKDEEEAKSGSFEKTNELILLVMSLLLEGKMGVQFTCSRASGKVENL